VVQQYHIVHDRNDTGVYDTEVRTQTSLEKDRP